MAPLADDVIQDGGRSIVQYEDSVECSMIKQNLLITFLMKKRNFSGEIFFSEPNKKVKL
jgi:hypothetical protein